jgi:hypothetical protein
MKLLVIILIISTNAVDSVCIKKETPIFKIQLIDTTTSIKTTTGVTLCQYNTGTKLNSRAQAKLIPIGNFNYTAKGTNADDCCIQCNLNPDCDYIFELQYQGKHLSNCAMYHFTDNSLTFIKKLKNGDYYDKKSYNTGFTIGYTNRFFGLIYK